MLQVSHLVVHRGGRALFADLSFRVNAGARLLVRGRNGAGKTSLLRVLAGLSRPEAGVLMWEGQMRADGLGPLCCFAGHSPALHGELSVAENLAFWASLGPVRLAWREALQQVGLGAASNLEVRRLSAGQRRRVAFARVLISTAPVWLLDEPLSNLDASGRVIVDAAVRAHRERGGIAVITTHESDTAADALTSELHIPSAGEQGA